MKVSVDVSIKFPFEPNSPPYQELMRSIEWAQHLEESLRPITELHRAAEFASANSAIRDFGLNISPFEGSYKFEMPEMASLQAVIDRLLPRDLPNFQLFANSAYIDAISKVALDLYSPQFEMTAFQNAAAAALGPSWQRFADGIEAQSAALQSVMAAQSITGPFARLAEQFVPLMDGIRLTAARSLELDSAFDDVDEPMFESGGAATLILDACQIVTDMQRTTDPTLQVSLMAKLARVIASSFAQFKQNTIKEFRAIGAIKLFELTMILVAFAISAAPSVPQPEEEAALAEIQSSLDQLGPQIMAMIEAEEDAALAHLAQLPRAELTKSTPIRSEPNQGSPLLLKGQAGDSIAIKGENGRWLLIVFRDPLTLQLCEGWVSKRAVSPISKSE